MPTRVKIGGVPIDLVPGGFTPLPFTRGIAPASWFVTQSNDAPLPTGVPLTIEIEATASFANETQGGTGVQLEIVPDGNAQAAGAGPQYTPPAEGVPAAPQSFGRTGPGPGATTGTLGDQVLTVGGWYVVDSEPGAIPGTTRYHLQDVRCLLDFGAYSGAPNQNTRRWAIGETSAPWRLEGRSSPTLIIHVIVEAIRQMTGSEPLVYRLTEAARQALPANLGNSAGGGFFSAKPREVLTELLNWARMDMTVSLAGEIALVPRSGASVVASRFRAGPVVSGSVFTRPMAALAPAKIIVQFPVRLVGTASTAAVGRTFVPQDTPLGSLQNVGYGRIGQRAAGGVNNLPTVARIDVLMSDYSREVGQTLNDSLIRRRYFQPTLWDYSTMGTDDVRAARILEGSLRAGYRRLYQLTPSNFLSDYELGNLDATGARAAGNTAFWGTFTVFSQVPFNQRLLTAQGIPRAVGELSQTVRIAADPFGNGASEGTNIQVSLIDPINLVVEVSPQNTSVRGAVDDVLVGELANPVGFAASVNNLQAPTGDPLGIQPVAIQTLGETTITEVESFGVVWNALVVMPWGIHNEEVDGVPDGKGPPLVLRVDDLPAVRRQNGSWAASPNSLLSFTLMNGQTLTARAQVVAESVRQSFAGGNAGQPRIDGVAVLRGIGEPPCCGDTFQVMVQVGDGAAWGVTTTAVVAPEPTFIVTADQKLRGVPVEAIL